jgi:hypothetical protein
MRKDIFILLLHCYTTWLKGNKKGMLGMMYNVINLEGR